MQTLSAFIQEAGLRPDDSIVKKGDLTIEKILEEKKVFDLSLRFEKTGLEDGEKWSLPGGIYMPLSVGVFASNPTSSAPSNPNQISTLPSATNLLHVSVQGFHGERPFQLLIASTADRNLHILTTDTFSIYKSLPYLQDSPILSCISFGEQGLKTITTGMSGQAVLYDHKVDRILDVRKDHTKYLVRVATWNEIVVTAGWDNKVFLYRANGDFSRLGDPVAALTLSTNPETITFVEHPDSDRPVLLVTRRDSTSLYYYSLELELLGSQNLAPHSNSWITFSPSSVHVCPKDPTLLAVVSHSSLISLPIFFELQYILQEHSAHSTTHATPQACLMT